MHISINHYELLRVGFSYAKHLEERSGTLQTFTQIIDKCEISTCCRCLQRILGKKSVKNSQAVASTNLYQNFNLFLNNHFIFLRKGSSKRVTVKTSIFYLLVIDKV